MYLPDDRTLTLQELATMSTTTVVFVCVVVSIAIYMISQGD